MATTHTKRIIYKVDDSGLKSARKSLSDAGESTKKLEEQTKKYGKEVEDAGKKGSKSFLALNDAIELISFAAIIEGARRLLTEVVRVSAQFQKLEAVLTTTLGSKSKAQLALAQIKNFAATTPYQVEQLSSAFVKLANQGLVMTSQQMRNLGDLAAATGKNFDMLAEAIIDAQVGEFERLKEFGIRASKQGDQVTFAFKGVKQQVDFTAESIQNYIIGLGQVEGVSGSMAAISETLGGKISNLQDSFTTFFDNLGKQSDGVLTKVIQEFKNLMDVVNEATETLEDKNLRESSRIFEGLIKGAEDMDKAQLDDLMFRLSENFKLVKKTADEAGLAAAHGVAGDGTIERFEAAKRELEAYGMAYEHVKDLIVDAEEEEEEKKKRLEELAVAYAEAAENAKKVMKEQQTLRDFKASEDYREWANAIKEELIPAYENLNKSISEGLEESDRAAEEATERELKRADEVYQAWKDSYDKQTKEAKEAARRKREIEEDVFEAGIDIIGQFLSASLEARQIDWDDFNTRKQEQLSLAGDNTEARAAIERRFAAEEKRLRAKEEEEAKKAAVKRILIETGLNAVRALGLPPIPGANFIAAGIATAFGLAQAATVSGFKDGIIDLQGPGTGTSDSISARLSKGESVITARSTARSKEMLRDIQAGKIDDKTYKMLMSGVPAASQGAIFDDRNIVSELRKNRPPEYDQIGSILYEYRTKGENTRQKIRKKFIN